MKVTYNQFCETQIENSRAMLNISVINKYFLKIMQFQLKISFFNGKK